MPVFTGEETPAEVMRLALEYFSDRQASSNIDAVIIYQDGVPYLQFQATVKSDLGEFTGLYRLDKMLLNTFPMCEQIYDEVDITGQFGEEDPEGKGRNVIVRHLAYHAMADMLTRLLLRQLVIFEENFDEARVLTTGTLLALSADISKEDGDEGAAKETTRAVQKLLNAGIETVSKQRRDLLAKLLNTFPPLNIPTGVGRPKGSKKPQEEKRREAAEFEQTIEETIRSLFKANGKVPTKTDVADALRMGGVNKAKGSDTRLNSFNNKLDRLGIDYATIIQRLDIHE